MHRHHLRRRSLRGRPQNRAVPLVEDRTAAVEVRVQTAVTARASIAALFYAMRLAAGRPRLASASLRRLRDHRPRAAASLAAEGFVPRTRSAVRRLLPLRQAHLQMTPLLLAPVPPAVPPQARLVHPVPQDHPFLPCVPRRSPPHPRSKHLPPVRPFPVASALSVSRAGMTTVN